MCVRSCSMARLFQIMQMAATQFGLGTRQETCEFSFEDRIAKYFQAFLHEIRCNGDETLQVDKVVPWLAICALCSFCSPSSKIVSFTRCYLTACSVLLWVFPAVCYIFSGSQGSVQQDDIGPVLRRATTFALYVFVVWHVLPFLFIFLCHFITDSNMASMLPKRAMQKASLMVKGVLGGEFQDLGQMVFVCSELCQLQVYINRQLKQLVYLWMIQSEDAWC